MLHHAPSHCLRHILVLCLAICLLTPAVAVAQMPGLREPRRIIVQTPGTLPTLIGQKQKYHLTDLSVEGALNGTDLRFLREMAGSDFRQQPTEGRLRRLDLRRATFVRGGEPYILKNDSVWVQGGPRTLPPFVFRHCGLEQVLLPERMDTIGTGAFEHSALRSISLPDSVVVQGWAFNGCDSLTRVDFPRFLLTLEGDCFRHCGSLRTLRLHDVQYLPYHVFQDVTGLEEIVIDGTLWHADGWFCDACPNLRRIEFGGVVLTAGGPPIASNCPRLSDITFSGFCFPIVFGSVENCPLVKRCRVTGSVMASSNADFLPSVTDVSQIDKALLLRALTAVRKMNGHKRYDMASVNKNRITRSLASVLTRRGMKKEALQTLEMLAANGFPFYRQITTDTAFTALKTDHTFADIIGKMRANANFLKIIRQSPAYDTGAMYRHATAPLRMRFPEAHDSTLQLIRAYFQTDHIAGAGSEVERLKNVMFWVHDRIKHRGDFMPHTRRSAIPLVEGFQRAGRDGMNARGIAIVLSELYQALGWPARFITCQSKYYPDDTDATVVTAVWSFDLGKWVMMDASMAAYVTDENGLLLHPGEIRQRMKDGRPLLLNKEANWNHQEKVNKEDYLDHYMAKNLYYMSGYLDNAPGIESENNAAYYTLAPEGEKVHIGITVYDDAWFWQKPF